MEVYNSRLRFEFSRKLKVVRHNQLSFLKLFQLYVGCIALVLVYELARHGNSVKQSYSVGHDLCKPTVKGCKLFLFSPFYIRICFICKLLILNNTSRSSCKITDMLNCAKSKLDSGHTFPHGVINETCRLMTKHLNCIPNRTGQGTDRKML